MTKGFGGKIEKGKITLKGGMIVDAKDLIAAKKAGIPGSQLMAYLEAKANQEEVAPAVEPVVKEPTVQWAAISREEASAYNRSIVGDKNKKRHSWIKRLFKGVK